MSTTTKMIFITVLVSAFICNGEFTCYRVSEQFFKNLPSVFLFIYFFFLGVFGGEILIAKSPPSVQFQGEDPIDQRLLPDLFSAALGFTTQRVS